VGGVAGGGAKLLQPAGRSAPQAAIPRSRLRAPGARLQPCFAPSDAARQTPRENSQRLSATVRLQWVLSEHAACVGGWVC
jgi:Tfp pilus assembly protein FimV